MAELPAVHENIFQLIWNLNLELFACKRKLFPDRLQILFYMRICLKELSGTKGQLHFLSAGGQFVMPLLKFAYTIHDGVVCVITEAERHGKVVPPQFNDTFAAQIQFLHLPVQVMLDLPIAHSICNELQLLRVNMLFAHPLDRKIRNRRSCLFFKLQPFQERTPALILPQPCKLQPIQAKFGRKPFLCRCSLENPFHAVVILCAFRRKPEQTGFCQLL